MFVNLQGKKEGFIVLLLPTKIRKNMIRYTEIGF